MKKISLFLSCLLCVSMLAGCGGSNSSGEQSLSSQVEQTTASEQSAAASQSDSSGFQRGTVENGVYTSEFAGLTFTAPEGWEYASDEYIASLMNIGLDVTGNNNDFTKAMLEQTTIYDALCMEKSTGKNIIIAYENIAKEVPDASTFTVDEYLDAVEVQLLASSSMICNKNGNRERVIIGGEEYVKQAFFTEYAQTDIKTEQVYYARKVGNFMLGFIMSSGNTSDDMTVYEENFGN